jgi:hypothetical protein
MSARNSTLRKESLLTRGAIALLLVCFLQPILTIEMDSELTEDGNQDVLINDSQGSSPEEDVPGDTVEIVEDVEDDLPADPSDPRLKKKSGKVHVFRLSFLILLWPGQV